MHAKYIMKWSTAAVPNLFGTRDWFRGRQFFQRPRVVDDFRMIQALHLLCTLCLLLLHQLHHRSRRLGTPCSIGSRKWQQQSQNSSGVLSLNSWIIITNAQITQASNNCTKYPCRSPTAWRPCLFCQPQKKICNTGGSSADLSRSKPTQSNTD